MLLCFYCRICGNRKEVYVNERKPWKWHKILFVARKPELVIDLHCCLMKRRRTQNNPFKALIDSKLMQFTIEQFRHAPSAM